MDEHYVFELPPLPYPYDALEPYIDEETMKLHHDKHFKTYVDNLNKALAPYPKYHSWSLEKLLKNINALPFSIQTSVKNNGGGVYNHKLYFSIMGPPNDEKPFGNLGNAMTRQFGTYDDFKTKFKQSALSVFGSGYAWLVIDRMKRLKIITTANQDTPLPMGYCPILLIDVWEHAYYLKYHNRRDEYIDSWFHIINWDAAEKNYNNCISERH